MNIELIKGKDIYKKAFKYIIEKSQSNNLPYHNISHLVDVFNFSYKLCDVYNVREIFSEKHLEMVSIAALFHDMNHSGGKLSDGENIKLAISSFESFMKEYDNKIDSEYLNFVKILISSTEFPHKDISEYNISDIFVKIIRDSDMMSIRKNNSLYTTIFGLGDESGIDLREQVNRQKKFLNNIDEYLYLDYSKEVCKKVKYKNISDVIFLDNILNKVNTYSKEEDTSEDKKMTAKEHLESIIGKSKN